MQRESTVRINRDEAYSYYGGMPYLINLKSDNEKCEYLKKLFAEVYIKDIVGKKKEC